MDIVAKWANGTYQCDGRSTSWLKIKNPDYSQMEGRHELFVARLPSATDRARSPTASACPLVACCLQKFVPLSSGRTPARWCWCAESLDCHVPYALAVATHVVAAGVGWPTVSEFCASAMVTSDVNALHTVVERLQPQDRELAVAINDFAYDFIRSSAHCACRARWRPGSQHAV
jgi:hypothetical protein